MKNLIWILACLSGLVFLGANGFGVSPGLQSGQNYRADIAGRVNVALLKAKAQGLDWWVRLQQGSEVAYFQGVRACEDCDVNVEREFFGLPQLIVDGDLAMARMETDGYRLNLRPQSDGSGQYEMVLVMRQTLDADAVAAQTRDDLSALGLTLDSPLSFQALGPGSKAKTAVPEDVKLDEVLYRLTLAPDWPDFAERQGMVLSGLRARVVVELNEGSQLPQGFDLVVEQQAQTSVRAQVLIPDLVRLAQDPASPRCVPR